MTDDGIRVIVGVDFGTTFSGFAYAHAKDKQSKVVTYSRWPASNVFEAGLYKCNSIVRYDPSTREVVSWGRGAVASPLKKQRARDKTLVAELFKLYLIDELDGKPELPVGTNYEEVIIDFLKKMNEVIREEITARWPFPLLRYPEDVRFVFTVPAECDGKKIGIMRKLIHAAGFTKTSKSRNLEFTTEPEAAAIYCWRLFKNQYEFDVDDRFLVVDCGGGTVDLTVRSFDENERLLEHTESTGGSCGSSFIDKEFIRFLGTNVTAEAMEKLKREHYQSYQFLCDYFSLNIKHWFPENPSHFKKVEFDVDDICPILKTCVTDANTALRLLDTDWVIPIEFADVKAMFDPVVSQILKLIRNQLTTTTMPIHTILLVGGFSESKYLQKRIRDKFGSEVGNIVCPMEPITAVVRGAVYYGLRMHDVKTRVLKWTYGIRSSVEWKCGDPPERKERMGNTDRIKIFRCYVKRGKFVEVDEVCERKASPVTPDQKYITFPIYYTRAENATYCDEDGVNLLGSVRIELPKFTGKDRPLKCKMTFGRTELQVTATCLTTGTTVSSSFELDLLRESGYKR